MIPFTLNMSIYKFYNMIKLYFSPRYTQFIKSGKNFINNI